MVVPLGGLGNRLDAMYEFHARHGIKPQRGHGSHDANGALFGGASLIRPSRWCLQTNLVAQWLTA
jgi:hypothetical protein